MSMNFHPKRDRSIQFGDVNSTGRGFGSDDRGIQILGLIVDLVWGAVHHWTFFKKCF